MIPPVFQKVASSILASILKAGYKNITSSDYSPFELELKQIIEKTVDIYSKTYPIAETDQIPFYQSMVIFEELLQYRFTNKLDEQKINNAIQADPRIIFPTDQQLKEFFKVFNQQLELAPNLKELNIQFHYKEEIFNISVQLQKLSDRFEYAINDFKQDIQQLNISAALSGEWSQQLEEISENIKSFKAYTAKSRLDKLEMRMMEAGVGGKKLLLSKLYFLQALCIGQIENDTDSNKEPEMLIKAYLANPLNATYKEYASMAYYLLKDYERSSKLSTEILITDQYNARAWATKCFLAEEKFKEELTNVPGLVKEKNEFLVILYRWLFSKKYIKTTREFHNLSLSFKVDVNKTPPAITHNNLQSNIIYAVYLLNGFYEKMKLFSNRLELPGADESKEFIYGNLILRNLESALRGTEIEKSHHQNFFLLYSTNLILTGDLINLKAMEKEYRELKEKNLEEVISMAQAYNNLNSEEGVKSSIQVLESYQGGQTEIIVLFLFMNYSILKDNLNTEKYALKYLNLHEGMNRQEFVNITMALRQRRLVFSKPISDKLTELSKSPQSDSIIRRLLKVVMFLINKDDQSKPEDIYQELKSLESDLKDSDEQLYMQIAFGYAHLDKYEDGINFLRRKLSFDQPSEGLKLLCKLLYKSQGNKPELLQLLKKWRLEFKYPDLELLDMEAYFARLNKNWKEQARIAKFGLDDFPNNEHLLYLFFTGLSEDQDIETIKNNAPLLTGVKFTNESNGIAISMALIKAGLFQQALDLMFEQASVRTNTRSRQSLLVLSTQFPKDLMKELPEVGIGSVVKYELKGKTYLTSIIESNHDKFPQNALMGKKKGDTFNISPKFGAPMETVKILRICDKYLGLFEEITQDAANPISGMDIQSFHIEGETVEEMNKSLIENFGIQGSLQKEATNKLLDDYHNGTISFSEITIQLFGNNPIDAYYALSNINGKFFRAISPAVSQQYSLSNVKNIILDFTTVCLFTELEEKFSLQFAHQFLVSSLVPALLANIIADIKNSPPSKMRLFISQEGVGGQLYPDDFDQKRIEHFERIQKWVNKHCNSVEVPERFNFIMDLPEESKHNNYFQLTLDNKLLADRDNSVLVTDDIFYTRIFKSPFNIIRGSQHYLYQYHSDKKNEILNYLLEHNYIGIPVSASLLQEELVKFLSGKENRYTICLENLKYPWNPSGALIGEAVKFVKSLYLGSLINDLTRQQVVSAIFSNILVGLPIRNAKLLPELILREFKMLPIQMLQVLDILNRVIETK